MRTLNFLRKALLAVFTLTLAINFAACSDDKENEFDPIKPAIKRLPKVMVETRGKGTETKIDKYTFEYNDDNQLVKVINYSEDKDGKETDVYTLSYSESGELIKLVKVDGGDSKHTTTCTYKYNADKGVIEIAYDGYTSREIKVDKNWYPVSNKDMNENNYDSYEYDKYNNLVKHISYYKNISDEVEEDMYTYNLAYSTVYSPIINLNLPAWFMTDGNIEFGLDYFIGNHTPKLITTEEITTITAEGQETIIDKETGIAEINIKESVDNYPTLLTSISEWKEKDEEGKEKTYTYTTSLSFEYITIE